MHMQWFLASASAVYLLTGGWLVYLAWLFGPSRPAWVALVLALGCYAAAGLAWRGAMTPLRLLGAIALLIAAATALTSNWNVGGTIHFARQMLVGAAFVVAITCLVCLERYEERQRANKLRRAQ